MKTIIILLSIIFLSSFCYAQDIEPRYDVHIKIIEGMHPTRQDDSKIFKRRTDLELIIEDIEIDLVLSFIRIATSNNSEFDTMEITIKKGTQ